MSAALRHLMRRRLLRQPQPQQPQQAQQPQQPQQPSIFLYGPLRCPGILAVLLLGDVSQMQELAPYMFSGFAPNYTEYPLVRRPLDHSAAICIPPGFENVPCLRAEGVLFTMPLTQQQRDSLANFMTLQAGGQPNFRLQNQVLVSVYQYAVTLPDGNEVFHPPFQALADMYVWNADWLEMMPGRHWDFDLFQRSRLADVLRILGGDAVPAGGRSRRGPRTPTLLRDSSTPEDGER